MARRVAVIFGGRSGEHEVSVRSARGVIAALDRDRWEPVPIAVTKSGGWLSEGESRAPLDSAALAFDGGTGGVLRSSRSIGSAR